MKNKVKTKTRSTAVILYSSFLIWIRIVFYFCKQWLKLLATRPRSPGQTGTTLRSITFMFRMLLCPYLLCSPGPFGGVWDFYSLKLQSKQYRQNISPKNYKTEIKILANIGLAQSSFEQPGPGARFSKAPKTFRARKDNFCSSVCKNGEVYTIETSCMSGTCVDIKNTWIKQLCNRTVRDFAMAFRARKVSGAFEKPAPGSLGNVKRFTHLSYWPFL